MSLGITLVGHQKKIMSSIQTMRAQMLHLHGTGVQVWWAKSGLLGQVTNTKSRTSVEQRRARPVRVKVSGRVLCLTPPAASGVESFLCSSVRDSGLSLQKALKRGKDKKQQHKSNYLDKKTFFFSFSFCRSSKNSTTYQRAGWAGVSLNAHWLWIFFIKKQKTCLLLISFLISSLPVCYHWEMKWLIQTGFSFFGCDNRVTHWQKQLDL